MPRVDVFIRIRDDSGNDVGNATFSVEPALTNELARYSSPETIVNYFGTLVRTQIMGALYRIPTLPQTGVSPLRSWGVPWDNREAQYQVNPMQQLEDYASSLSRDTYLRDIDPIARIHPLQADRAVAERLANELLDIQSDQPRPETPIGGNTINMGEVDPTELIGLSESEYWARTRRRLGPTRNQVATEPTTKSNETRASIPSRYNRKPVI